MPAAATTQETTALELTILAGRIRAFDNAPVIELLPCDKGARAAIVDNSCGQSAPVTHGVQSMHEKAGIVNDS
jgi:hypothetical protein